MDNTRPSFIFERKIVAYGVVMFVVLVAIQYLAGFFLPRLQDFSQYFAGLALSVAVGMTAVWHIAAYRKSFPCMSGMMAGMTVGMIIGFLIGYVVGITNGMFTSAVYGSLVGMSLGAWCGSGCGVMGWLEGMMAGIMAGTMGGMLGVMIRFDRPILFFWFLFIVCIAILIGLGKMVYQEAFALKLAPPEQFPWQYGLAVAFLILFLTDLVIAFGPRGLGF
ncbi:MAG: hypothetical protein V1707_01975 [bacterium]